MNARFFPLDAFIPNAARIGLCTAVLLPAIAAQTPFGPIISLNQPARSPGSMMVEDVNGDGRLDLIYSDNGRDEIMWVERLATDEFAPPKQLTQLSSGISVVRRGDIDGDGDADLIGMGAQHGLLWIERTAQGFRAFPQVVGPWLRSVTDLQLADIDADGDLDVVLARHHNAVPASAALVSFLRNDGTGNFGSQTIVYGGSTPNLPSVEFIAEDLSGDGATELIAAHNGQVFVLPNAGDGSFQSPVVLDSGAGPMLLEDVTGDGLSDLGSCFAVLRRRFRGPGGSSGIQRVCALEAGSLDNGG
ncbi:FG-GAP repeat protein [Planctomycetes bacterium Poly30]|uniref:FG-GAP repeat protein n=1 Tax=Saltatorellus ferox TaxID=2528018 RepID=A0A518EKV4_9BACT|nr:FG-GAP repeat protein [Planctomycetes bacterium Poly30]